MTRRTDALNAARRASAPSATAVTVAPDDDALSAASDSAAEEPDSQEIPEPASDSDDDYLAAPRTKKAPRRSKGSSADSDNEELDDSPGVDRLTTLSSELLTLIVLAIDSDDEDPTKGKADAVDSMVALNATCKR